MEISINTLISSTNDIKQVMEKKKSNFMKFTGMGVQMGFIIGIFTWFGNFLDKKQANETPGWTVTFSLIGVLGAMYLMIKEIKNLSNE